MTPTEYAWAAGFVDGEGYLAIRPSRRSSRIAPIGDRVPRKGTSARTGYLSWARQTDDRKSFHLFVQVVNRNPAPIRRFHTLFGGKFYESLKKSKDRCPVFAVHLHGASAANCLRRVLPFLVGKRALAELCVTFYDWYSGSAVRKGHPMSPERRAWASELSDECTRLIRLFRLPPQGSRPALALVGAGTGMVNSLGDDQ